MDATDRLLRKLRPRPMPNRQIITNGLDMNNNSGDHSFGMVRDTPVEDIDIPNKAYVDTLIAGIHPALSLSATANGLSLAAATQVLTLSAASASNAGAMTAAYAAKLDGIEAGAEVNNISDADATDLTDGNYTTLHRHTGVSNGNAQVICGGDNSLRLIAYNGDTEIKLSSASISVTLAGSHYWDIDEDGIKPVTDDICLLGYANKRIYSAAFGSGGVTISGGLAIDGNIVHNGSSFYLGTADAQGLYFKTNKTVRFAIGSTGNITSAHQIYTSNYFYGKYKASNGVAGASASISFVDASKKTNTVTIKDGLITDWTKT